MKSTYRHVPLFASLLALGTGQALAQVNRDATAPAPATQSAAPMTQTSPRSATETDRTLYTGMKDSASWERAHRASKIIGMDVVNRQGEKIGDVEDIVLDNKGAVAYAVVSTGGFLGMGDRLHAVPWQAIQTNTGKDNFVLDIDRDRLKTAPGFDQRSWPNFADQKWGADNNRYFPPRADQKVPSTGR